MLPVERSHSKATLVSDMNSNSPVTIASKGNSYEPIQNHQLIAILMKSIFEYFRSFLCMNFIK